MKVNGVKMLRALRSPARSRANRVPSTPRPPTACASSPPTEDDTERRTRTVEVIRGGLNQYPPDLGIPELRQAVGEHRKQWYGLGGRQPGGRVRNCGMGRASTVSTSAPGTSLPLLPRETRDVTHGGHQ